jgi:hypothetical protein
MENPYPLLIFIKLWIPFRLFRIPAITFIAVLLGTAMGVILNMIADTRVLELQLLVLMDISTLMDIIPPTLDTTSIPTGMYPKTT